MSYLKSLQALPLKPSKYTNAEGKTVMQVCYAWNIVQEILEDNSLPEKEIIDILVWCLDEGIEFPAVWEEGKSFEYLLTTNQDVKDKYEQKLKEESNQTLT